MCPRVNIKAVKIIKMGKTKHRIMLEVLDNVPTNYPETAQYIENNMMGIFSREKSSVEEISYSVVLLCR